MSSEALADITLSRCLFCSLGCPAGLQARGLDQYAPAYPDRGASDYAGLCARGSMFAELANHRDRLLWGLVRDNGRMHEVRTDEAIARAAEAFRVAVVNGHPRIVIDGNIDVTSLDRAVTAFARHLPAERIAVSVPAADRDLLAGCDTSPADYASPPQLAEADAMLVVGNPFASHPVSAHWMLDLDMGRKRRPLLVLDVRAGVTVDYATDATVVPMGREHVLLAELARASGVSARDASADDALDPARAKAWADVLTKASRPAVVVACEYGRASRWFEIGLLAGRIARAVGGVLLPLTICGGSLGAVRLMAGRGLADAAALRRESRSDSAGLSVLIGDGVVSQFQSCGRSITATSLRPSDVCECEVAMPLAWPFETSGTLILPGQAAAAYHAAASPPSGVPTLAELAAGLTGGTDRAGHGQATVDPLARTSDSRTPDFSALAAVGNGDGLCLVLVADPVNFAGGALTRRVSFPAKVLPEPVIAIGPEDARRVRVSDGHILEISSPGASVRARVEVEERQAAGQAVLYGAYAESQQIVAAACGDKEPAPVWVNIRRI